MKYARLLLLAGLFFFIGCSSDDDSNTANGINKNLNLQATGSSANDFLSASRYQSLVIEVFYVTGFRPNTQTLVNLKNFMQVRLNKPGGVTILEKEIDSPGTAPFDINEIAALENSVRTKYNNGSELAMSMLFVDGGTTIDSSNSFILGQAYRNTSFVMYESTIQNMSNSVGEPNRVDLETTVILHEVGHLLGLVNLGSAMQNEHLDETHDKHCDNSNCLMFWEVENSNMIMDMMLGGNIPELDANCLADLQANGGK